MVCIATRESAKWSVHRSYSVRVRASVHPSDTSYRARGIRNLFPGRGGTEISNPAPDDPGSRVIILKADPQVARCQVRTRRADVARTNAERQQEATAHRTSAALRGTDCALPGFNSFAAGYEPPP